jgi:hypothetical protein
VVSPASRPCPASACGPQPVHLWIRLDDLLSSLEACLSDLTVIDAAIGSHPSRQHLPDSACLRPGQHEKSNSLWHARSSFPRPFGLGIQCARLQNIGAGLKLQAGGSTVGVSRAGSCNGCHKDANRSSALNNCPSRQAIHIRRPHRQVPGTGSDLRGVKVVGL